MIVSCIYKFMSCRHEVLSFSTSILTEMILGGAKFFSHLHGEIFQKTKFLNTSLHHPSIFEWGEIFFECGGMVPRIFYLRKHPVN